MFNKTILFLVLMLGSVGVIYPLEKPAAQEEKKAELFCTFPQGWQKIAPKMLEKVIYYYPVYYNYTSWGEKPLIWGCENVRHSAEAPWVELFVYKNRAHGGISAARMQKDHIANFYEFARKKKSPITVFELLQKGSLQVGDLHLMWHSGNATIFGKTCFIKTFFFFKDGYMYEMLFTAKQEDASKVEKQIDAVIKSIYFK